MSAHTLLFAHLSTLFHGELGFLDEAFIARSSIGPLISHTHGGVAKGIGWIKFHCGLTVFDRFFMLANFAVKNG